MQNKYKINGEVTEIFAVFRGNEVVISVDTKDFEKINQITGSWLVFSSSSNNVLYSGYKRKEGKRIVESFLMHRLILEAKNNQIIDHINCNGLDNRRSNLRIVDKSQNGQNRTKAMSNSKSGVLGVHKHGNKWAAQLVLKGKTMNLGSYGTIEEAERIVKIARAKYMDYSQERKYVDPKEFKLLDTIKTGPQGKNKSGYRYVNWSKQHNKWIVQIWVGKTKYFFGYYVDVEDAARVANEMKKIYKS